MKNNEITLNKEHLRLISDLIVSLKLQINQLENQIRLLRLNNLGGSQCQN